MSPTSMFAILAVAAAAVVGCTGDERVAPAPTEGGEGGSGTTSTTTGSTSTASSGAGTPVREVLIRNPLGEQTGNLLADGDFELSITSNPGQQGWTFYGLQGAGPIQAETGGLCRSGLRCAHVPANGTLFGRGTAAADLAPMFGEVWVKPLQEGETCSNVTVYAISCDSFTVLGTLSALPGQEEEGWCAKRAAIAPAPTGVCLYLENDGPGAVLVDHASVRAREDDPGDTSRATPHVPAPTRARMARLRDHLRKTLPLGPPAHDLDLDPRP